MLYVPSGFAVLNFVAIVLRVAEKPCDLFIHVLSVASSVNSNIFQTKLYLLSTVLLSEFQSFLLSKAVSGKYHGSGGQSKRHCLQDQANVHMSLAWQLVLIINTGFSGTEAIVWIVWLPPCLESYHGDMGIHARQQTTTKHNKVQTVCRSYGM